MYDNFFDCFCKGRINRCRVDLLKDQYICFDLIAFSYFSVHFGHNAQANQSFFCQIYLDFFFPCKKRNCMKKDAFACQKLPLRGLNPFLTSQHFSPVSNIHFFFNLWLFNFLLCYFYISSTFLALPLLPFFVFSSIFFIHHLPVCLPSPSLFSSFSLTTGIFLFVFIYL